jgi:hypothetical protein
VRAFVFLGFLRARGRLRDESRLLRVGLFVDAPALAGIRAGVRPVRRAVEVVGEVRLRLLAVELGHGVAAAVHAERFLPQKREEKRALRGA